MTVTTRRPTPVILARFGWHRPLLWLSLAMIAFVAVALVGLLVDPRTVTEAAVWAKPLKFAISTLVYSLTLSWMLALLARGTRLAWWAGATIAAFLAVELVIIFGAAAAGTTSHFNTTTPLAVALWGTMAVSITIVWSATVVVALLLFRADLGDPARSLAIRSGVVIALLGMGLAFLMTGPTAAQLSDFQGIAGAHTVGIPDGGPGVPLLGWSTVAGDLRIPHFVGMHAMQLMPIAALLLEFGSRRFAVLGQARTRRDVLIVLSVLYLGIVATLTGQALAGQSIVRPDATMVAISTSLFLTAAVAVSVIVARGRRVS